LVDPAFGGLEGARQNGHRGEKIYLYDYQISACIDCRSCKEKDYACCLQSASGGFGTPIYYGPTAKMKLLIDRMRPFIASKRLQGKKAVLVVPSEEGPTACKALLQMFRLSLNYLGMQLAGKLLATAYQRAEIANNKKELNKAYQLGIAL